MMWILRIELSRSCTSSCLSSSTRMAIGYRLSSTAPSAHRQPSMLFNHPLAPLLPRQKPASAYQSPRPPSRVRLGPQQASKPPALVSFPSPHHTTTSRVRNAPIIKKGRRDRRFQYVPPFLSPPLTSSRTRSVSRSVGQSVNRLRGIGRRSCRRGGRRAEAARRAGRLPGFRTGFGGGNVPFRGTIAREGRKDRSPRASYRVPEASNQQGNESETC
jgi:hypothetical protein